MKRYLHTLALVVILIVLTVARGVSQQPSSESDSTAVSDLPEEVTITILRDEDSRECRYQLYGCVAYLVDVDSLRIWLGFWQPKIAEQAGTSWDDMDVIFVPDANNSTISSLKIESLQGRFYLGNCVIAPPHDGRWLEKNKGLASQVTLVDRPMKLADHVYSTGAVYPPHFNSRARGIHAIIVETERGLVVATECRTSHIALLVKTAKEYLKQDILLVIGGYGDDEPLSSIDLELESEELQHLGVSYFASLSCSRLDPGVGLEKAFGDHYLTPRVGDTLRISELE